MEGQISGARVLIELVRSRLRTTLSSTASTDGVAPVVGVAIWVASILGAWFFASPALAAGEWLGPTAVDPGIEVQAQSCASASFCMAVGYKGSMASAVTYDGSAWGEASLIEPEAQLFSVSCPSASFCMAMDGLGRALTYDGSSWSTSDAFAKGKGLTSVSCASSVFCVAVGGAGYAATYDGSDWSAPTQIDPGGNMSISCSSQTFCMAVNSAGYALRYDGASWSGPVVVDPKENAYLHSVTCPSASFCAAGASSGEVFTFDGSTWSGPQQVGISSTIASVSCHSSSFCVAVSGEEATTYNGTKWSLSHPGAQFALSAAVSCPTDSFCEVAGPGPLAISDHGGTWSKQIRIGGGVLDVSCSSASFCAALDRNGRALTLSGLGWSAPVRVDAERQATGLSCPSASFCAGVGGLADGWALTYDGSAWGPPAQIDPDGFATSVSCVSDSFCMAVANHTVEGQPRGFAIQKTAGGWGAPEQVDAEGRLESVSCALESFCVAVGGHHALLYIGSSWGAPQEISPEAFLEDVSCPSTTFCMAAAQHSAPGGSRGVALSYSHGAWSGPTQPGLGPGRAQSGVRTVSCASRLFCVAASPEGEVSLFDGSDWTAWSPLELNGGFLRVSCPSAAFCVLVDEAGQAFTYLDPSPPTEAGTEEGSGAAEHPAPSNSGESSAGVTPAAPRPALRLFQRSRIRVNARTGVLGVRIGFPAAGKATTRAVVLGEVRDAGHLVPLPSRPGPAAARVSEPHALYGPPATRVVGSGGAYELRIEPDKKALHALRTGKALIVGITTSFWSAEGVRSLPIETKVTVRLISEPDRPR
jgi:hypothetical protein